MIIHKSICSLPILALHDSKFCWLSPLSARVAVWNSPSCLRRVTPSLCPELSHQPNRQFHCKVQCVDHSDKVLYCKLFYPPILDRTMADIVDIAVGAGSFNTLVTAVKAANLVDALKSPGPFTVFAPNDDAFAKLPPGTIQTLVQNIPQLSRILTFHVVSGKYMKADLEKLESLPSLEGSPIPFHFEDGFEVKNATVLAADIEADNGVIHVIDTVILMG